MTNDEVTAILNDAITQVAPDVDPTDVESDEDIWFALDLDSMDQLNVMIAIRERTGIEVPEADYPKLATIGGMVDYLVTASAG